MSRKTQAHQISQGFLELSAAKEGIGLEEYLQVPIDANGLVAHNIIVSGRKRLSGNVSSPFHVTLQQVTMMDGNWQNKLL